MNDNNKETFLVYGGTYELCFCNDLLLSTDFLLTSIMQFRGASTFAQDQSVSKRNFGGRVQRHHECQVCAISRHSFFHGNLCPECEYGLRKVGCRAYSRLTAEQKNRVIDMSRQSRASKASSQETAMAARLADAALILVRERLQNGE